MALECSLNHNLEVFRTRVRIIYNFYNPYWISFWVNGMNLDRSACSKANQGHA